MRRLPPLPQLLNLNQIFLRIPESLKHTFDQYHDFSYILLFQDCGNKDIRKTLLHIHISVRGFNTQVFYYYVTAIQIIISYICVIFLGGGGHLYTRVTNWLVNLGFVSPGQAGSRYCVQWITNSWHFVYSVCTVLLSLVQIGQLKCVRHIYHETFNYYGYRLQAICIVISAILFTDPWFFMFVGLFNQS